MDITTKTGDILTITEADIYIFPEGLVGFEQHTRFVIIDPEENSTFKWLQSVDSPDVAFVVTAPALFWPEYRVAVHQDSLKTIKMENDTPNMIIVIVQTPDGSLEKMTANLVAPIIINMQNKHAKQIVLSDPQYTTKHSIAEAIRRATC